MDSYDLIRVQYDYNRVSIVFLWNSYGIPMDLIGFQSDFNRFPIGVQ